MREENYELMNDLLKSRLEVCIDDSSTDVSDVKTVAELITNQDKVAAEIEKERIKAAAMIEAEKLRAECDLKARALVTLGQAGLFAIGWGFEAVGGRVLTLKSHNIFRSLKP